MIGATIRTVRHRWRPVLTVPYRSMGRHQVIIGSSGSGKTNLMMRTWAGWYAAARTAAPAPGGRRARCWSCWTARAARTPGSRPPGPAACCTPSAPAGWRSGPTRPGCRCGACRPVTWPSLLFQMIETGTGAAAYYADITQAVLTLALTAPGGPPANAASFLDRLDVAWLEAAYGDGLHDGRAVPHPRRQNPRSATSSSATATLLGRLGPALDGPGSLDGADAWYFILEGTREQVRRRSPGHGPDRTGRARRHHRRHRTPGDPAGRRRLLGRVRPGAAVATCTNAAGPSASGCRSRPSPGRDSARDDDERYRIAATADGGIWLLRTPYPEPQVSGRGESH